MGMWFRGVGLTLALGLALLGCESSDPVVPDPESSFFRAAIGGAIAANYEGSGHFYSGTDIRRPFAASSFSLFSTGRGESASQTFLLFRPEVERPRPGTYTLGLDGAQFRAHFSRTGNLGETLESYAASEGELEITVSTAERIEGSFRMKGFRTCLRESAGSRTQVGCVAATQVIPDAPVIQVTGSFAAVPAPNAATQWR